ncbi:hypothetical protein INT47_007431 [Mucor saturninus]|uniref:Cation efflux protein transmembrane domain-containing protein n=1 Tax=Mucor saturninus TaxID=64648 RepID=A0A8H7QZ96_9FUNG|nr:hypothetical protein INT47_007431 [Mucor saturninus]
MTHEKPGGIAIQSSAPLYTQKQQEHLSEEKVPSNAFTNVYAPPVNVPANNDEHHDHPHTEPHIHHDHAQHDHSHDDAHHDHSHDHHDHGPEHVHHDHSHEKVHVHHGHGHDHSHDHAHHNHGHQHSYSPVFTRPLPSWIHIFSHLAPAQKTIFTWFLIHAGIGIWLYCMGTNRESLSLVGFSYLMIFDALGVLNSFISSVLRTNPAFGTSNTKRPFGAHRYEIVFALGTTIYLMFATMHNTKESLEHFLLQDHHKAEAHDKEDHHLKLSLGMFLLVGAALTATCLSSITLRNHDNFVRYLRRRPTTVHGFSYNVINRARGNPFHALLSNVYSLSIVLCGSVILVAYMCGIATPFVDKILALSESVVMFYLGYPTAKSLAKVLLQTTPNTVQNGVENRLREIQQDTNIIHVDRVHFWQTTYGKCVGTIEIRVRPEADEQAVLQFVYQKLEGLTSSDDNESELTVSIVK